MAEKTATFERAVRLVHRHRGLLLPVAAAGLIFVLLVPLPPAMMDLLLAANLAMSAVVLLTAIYVHSPMEFSVFPSLLLGVTLLRLVLNVASTRLILTAGAGGQSAAGAQLAAGRMIWAFSQFVTSGSLAVGVIVFAIILVIQFVVVTRGASRIGEVAARFVLDAMPGKQMAIDAELSGGAITAQQAQERRSAVAREADFYGAMDGAGKFLRGDAVAAAIITLVNILGGLYVGMVQHGWSFEESCGLFARLTVGDGLVTQIPAFIVSTAAALLVTRSAGRSSLGEQVVGQLVSRPVVLVITAAFLAALTLTHLPRLPLLAMGSGCIGLAWMLRRRGQGRAQGSPSQSAAPAGALAKASPAPPADQQLPGVDPLRIEIGYALVRLVDASAGGDLLDRIANLRRQLAAELGVVVPPVRISDNMRLEAHTYAIQIRGACVAAGQIYPGQLLAIPDEHASDKLPGRATNEPAFGVPAVWISPDQRQQAELLGHTTVEPSAVLATHLGEVIRSHSADLLTRQQVFAMLESLRARSANVVQEVLERFKVGQVQKVLQNLLRERVCIRDMEAILEAMSDWAGRTDDAEPIGEHVRCALGRALSQRYCSRDGKLYCVALDGAVEQAISSHVRRTERGSAITLSPPAIGKFSQAVGSALATLRRQGRTPVLLCSPAVRPAVRQMLAPSQPDAAVLGYNEIDSVQVQTVGTVEVEL